MFSMTTSKNRWWIFGFFYGAFMFLIVGVLLPLSEDQELTIKGLLFRLIYWLLGGLFISWLMSYIDGRRKAIKKESPGS